MMQLKSMKPHKENLQRHNKYEITQESLIRKYYAANMHEISRGNLIEVQKHENALGAHMKSHKGHKPHMLLQ